MRNEDVLARLGGDEFAVIQTAPRDATERTDIAAVHKRAASDLASRILEILAVPFELGGNTVFIGSSIGVAMAPEDGADPEDLMKKADLALYEAKSDGRNRFFFFTSEMTRIADQRHRLEADMRAGLDRGEFVLHYQPIIDVWTRKVVCVEALVRWRHPEHGLMLPDEFVPLAEETSLINQLGAFVLEQACHDATSWPDHVKVAVNLSATQFRNADFLDTVLGALIAPELPPRRLEVEVTETVLLAKETDCIALLHQLRSLGISVALDDFGTGYSSLSYLKRFPFDKIKIDKSFTNDITERADCAAIVSSIIGLGRSLDIGTIVEGVETERQFEMIRAAGATFAQGYLFGRPVPAAQLDFGTGDAERTAGAAA
jgi:predicted signal transduction protein with EAL and GGDEF domain